MNQLRPLRKEHVISRTKDRKEAGISLRRSVAVIAGIILIFFGTTTAVSAHDRLNRHERKHVRSYLKQLHHKYHKHHKRNKYNKQESTPTPSTQEPQNASLVAIPLTRATPSDGTDRDLALQNAPKVPLFSAGQLSIYGKCYRDLSVNPPMLYVGTYIETSADGAVFSSRERELMGGTVEDDFLNTTTPETYRTIHQSRVRGDNAEFENADENDFSAVSADGATGLRGLTFQGVKQDIQGNQDIIPFNGGIYGPDDGCLWGGFVNVSTAP